MNDDICFLPAVELSEKILGRDISAREAVEAFISRIERRNRFINAYVTLLFDQARFLADHADASLARGIILGPLHGIPICLKDLAEDKAGVPTTMGAPPIVHYVPEKNSAYVDRLEQAGAIVLGKTNVPELGAAPNGAIADNRTFGATRAPLTPDFSSAGSSGGSAAAVVDGMCAIAQGQDGGGSLRIPAAWCGAYSIKPSFGRVPVGVRPDAFAALRPNIIVGPISRTVSDSAFMLASLVGAHDADPFSLPDDGFSPMAAIRRGVKGMRIGYSRDMGIYTVEPAIAEIVGRAVKVFEDAGAILEDARFTLPLSAEEMGEAWTTEISVQNVIIAEHMRERGVDVLGKHRGELGEQFIEWVERGYRTSAADYARASVARTRIYDAFQEVFQRFDLLITPTANIFPISLAWNEAEQKLRANSSSVQIAGQMTRGRASWFQTRALNLTGHPAASIPAGFHNEFPVGMQIIGRRYRDDDVLAASAIFERLRPWAWAYNKLRH